MQGEPGGAWPVQPKRRFCRDLTPEREIPAQHKEK